MPMLTLQISDEAFEFLGKQGDPAIVAAQILEAAAETDIFSRDPEQLKAFLTAVQVGVDEDDRGESCEFSAQDIGREGRAKLAEMRRQNLVKEAV